MRGAEICSPLARLLQFDWIGSGDRRAGRREGKWIVEGKNEPRREGRKKGGREGKRRSARAGRETIHSFTADHRSRAPFPPINHTVSQLGWAGNACARLLVWAGNACGRP